MSDSQTITAIGTIITAFGVIIGPIVMARINGKIGAETTKAATEAAKAAAEAALKVEEVRSDLRERELDTQIKLAEIAAVGKQSLILVNGAHGATLKALAIALRVIASERQTPENVAAADAAEAASAQHEATKDHAAEIAAR